MAPPGQQITAAGNQAAVEKVVADVAHGPQVANALNPFRVGAISKDGMMGVGLAAAVFFDAFIVRMTIVPAVLALLGDKAWWLPRRLQQILPHVDVEGERLRHLDVPELAPTRV